jgi:DNA-binding CsgD family transcriptional regulator
VYHPLRVPGAHEVSGRHKGITACFRKSGKPVKLSKQQKKMLEFLAQGYNNAEVARLTGLALPTVKIHLMLAYEKLGVHNAMDAVIKARELQMIQMKKEDDSNLKRCQSPFKKFSHSTNVYALDIVPLLGKYQRLVFCITERKSPRCPALYSINSLFSVYCDFREETS